MKWSKIPYKGFIFSYKMRGRGGKGVEVFHLLFPDDTLIFLCEACKDQMIFLSWILMWLDVISRLEMNLEKSSWF